MNWMTNRGIIATNFLTGMTVGELVVLIEDLEQELREGKQ